MPVIRIQDESGASVDDPSGDAVGDMIADMTLNCRFVVVDRFDREPVGAHYFQVRLEDDLSYRLEYRDGDQQRHFAARLPAPTVATGGRVARLVESWISDDDAWQTELPWMPLADFDAAEDLQMVVQLRTHDIDLRYSLEDEFMDALRGVADVDGGDIGSSTANIFIRVHSTSWEPTLAAVRGVLAERGLLDEAVIARHQPVPADTIIVVGSTAYTSDFAY